MSHRLHYEWTSTQEATIAVLCVVSSFLSVVGSAYVITRKRAGRQQDPAANDELVVVLAVLNLVSALFFGMGPLAAEVDDSLCKAQAFGIQLFALMSVLWTACMGHNLFMWVVGKQNERSLRRNHRLYLLGTVAVSVVLAVVLLVNDDYGRTGPWCWVNDTRFQFPFFWGEVLVAWVFNLVVFVAIQRETFKRATMTRRLLGSVSDNLDSSSGGGGGASGGASGGADDNDETRIIAARLSLYLGVFVFEWFFGLLNRGINQVAGTYFIPTVLHCFFVPLQGWLNAVVYGSLHGGLSYRPSTTLAALPGARLRDDHAHGHGHDQEAGAVFGGESRSRSSTGSRKGSESAMRSLSPVPLPQSVSVFAATWNVAETRPPPNIRDLLQHDARQGCDVYALGLQECVHVRQYREAFSDILGDEYSLHELSIGSSQTYLGFHGYIVLFCFVRANLEADGLIQRTEIATTKGVSRGVNLVPGLLRAPNKGAVGLAFRILDAHVAFLTAHLAADIGGMSGVARRNKDVKAILRSFAADYDDLGCEVQLGRHHTIFMGDLNYRLDFESAHDALAVVSRVFKREDGSSAPRTPVACNAQARDELMSYDQLSRAHANGQAFANWVESEVTFPPSYRFVKKVLCSDFGDMQELAKAYSTKARKDGKKRVPSYTDRILFHSLPDCTGKLVCSEYSTTNTLVASDHRPVHARLTLHPIASRQEQRSRAGPTQWWATTVVLSNLQVVAREEGGSGEKVAEVEALKLVFPLPFEDPFAQHHKLAALTAALTGLRPETPSSGAHQHVEWAHAQQHGVSATATCKTHNLHLLVEVLPGGYQTVLSLALFQRGEQCSFDTSLVLGGVHVANLRGTLLVTRREAPCPK